MGDKLIIVRIKGESIAVSNGIVYQVKGQLK